jgi:DNA polymerase-3 subunit epsilon
MWQLRLRRWRWKFRSEPAEVLLANWSEPLPASGLPAEKVNFLVCDAEMSGLNPDDAELLSLGWVRISHGEIVLASARHQLIRNTQSVGQSATIHRLRDCELEAAADAAAAIDTLLQAAKGCVLVFHNAALDLAFLDRAAKRCLGAPLLLPAVDTLRLEQRLLQRRDQVIGDGDLRLQACRDRYGLASHSAHNALEDALATAELLLAHIRSRGSGVRLRDLL